MPLRTPYREMAARAAPIFMEHGAIRIVECWGDDALTAGGGSPVQCGWLKDRYDLSWQIVPRQFVELMSDPDPDKARRVMNAMLGMVRLEIEALQRAAGGG